MSRTYRKVDIWHWCAIKKWAEENKIMFEGALYDISPPSWYIKGLVRNYKAKCKEALIKGREVPVFKKSAWYSWW